MEEFFKICAVAVTAVLLTLILKKDNPSAALLLGAAAVMVIVCIFISAAAKAAEFICALAETAGVSQAIILPLIKITALAAVCRIVSDICRDGSSSALASAVDISGVCIGFYISLPILTSALEMISGLL